MDINIDRKSKVPVYIQVKNKIINDIKSGRLKLGDKLPTERQLAKIVSTSRNTISNAYNLLEQEGILVSYQGKGTFVAEEEKTWKHETIKDKVVRIIDLALDEALEIGLNTEEFLGIVRDRVKEKELIMKNANVIFIECNVEQAKAFAKEFGNITGLKLTPLIISQIINMDKKVKKIVEKHNIIITPFSHVNEIKNLIDDRGKEVFGVAVNPSFETIVKIAKCPKRTSFGLISLSNKFCLQVEYALKSAGLEEIEIRNSTSKRKEDILSLIEESDVIIVSPGRSEEIKDIVGDEKEIIRFDYTLDQNSVKIIMSKILEAMEHKK